MYLAVYMNTNPKRRKIGRRGRRAQTVSLCGGSSKSESKREIYSARSLTGFWLQDKPPLAAKQVHRWPLLRARRTNWEPKEGYQEQEEEG